LEDASCQTYSVHKFIRIEFSFSLNDGQIQSTKYDHVRFLSYPFQLPGVINSELKDFKTPRRQMSKINGIEITVFIFKVYLAIKISHRQKKSYKKLQIHEEKINKCEPRLTNTDLPNVNLFTGSLLLYEKFLGNVLC
jgi:hypothetical protein